jgi:integrase
MVTSANADIVLLRSGKNSASARAGAHRHPARPLALGPTGRETRNNKMSALRQALDSAVLDGLIKGNPCFGIKNAKHQTPEPDPFSIEEVEIVLADMRKYYPPQIVSYFEFKFFTGLRTSESLAIKWSAIDWSRHTMLVSEGIVMGLERDRTKIGEVRSVQLNTRAMQALQRQKQHTFLRGDFIFLDPKDNERWRNDEPPRKTYWNPTLKRLRIRRRSPYETRHTYATMLLMAGATPAWSAKQLGHAVEVFCRKYAPLDRRARQCV